jgi:hypothetical protein
MNSVSLFHDPAAAVGWVTMYQIRAIAQHKTLTSSYPYRFLNI